MRGVAGARCGVKASGGIRTLADVRHFLKPAQTALAHTASVAIVRETGSGVGRATEGLRDSRDEGLSD